MAVAIRVENLSKAYQLGEIGTGTLSRDIERWFAKVRGKEDPFLKVGETNDRTSKGTSDVVWSLKDINFEIEQGDAVGIIGRNGAGKSTLLKLLSRVTSPTTGSIKVKGRIASLLEVGTGFHPELTGRENIYLNGAILGMRKKEITQKFDEIVDFAGVDRYIDTPVKRYSSGMYVRLAFAVAAYLESETLIVDEVLAVGDMEFQKKCLGKMGEISKGEGRTVLFVSHNLNSIEQLCNIGIILQNGKLNFYGSVGDACKTYKSISSDYLTNKSSYIKEANPDNEITIRNAQLFNDKKELSSYFEFRDTISLSIEYYVNKAIQGSVINFIVSNQTQELFMSFDIDKSEELLYNREEGNYKSVLSIPGGRLKPGNYSVSVGAGVANRKAIEQVDNCLAFEVHADVSDYLFKSFYKDRRGIIPMYINWETQKL